MRSFYMVYPESPAYALGDMAYTESRGPKLPQGMHFLSSFDPPIVHGDLKSRNILIDSTFRAKVTDFGLTRQRKAGAGTPLWMAPELLIGGEATVKSDVYAFGVTLFEIITRKEPFEGQEVVAVLQRVIDNSLPDSENRPEIPSSCPAVIATEMRRCWSFEPADRPNFHDLHTWVLTLDASSILTKPSESGVSAPLSQQVTLLSKFPPHVSEALAEGKLPAPDTTDCATIFYADVVGFRTLSKRLSSEEQIDLLDRLYGAFDEIAAAYDVFKVETIGDTYVAVTNLATAQEDHAERLARFAMHALRKASTIMVHPEKLKLGFVEIRIGMHSGPLAASVVGTRTKKYCLFGDSLNIAARMEAAGVPGKVLMSKECARLVNIQAPDIGIVERGIVRIKGRGKMCTYFLIRDGDLGEDEIYMPPTSLTNENGDYESSAFDSDMSGVQSGVYDSQASYQGTSSASNFHKMKSNFTSWFQGHVHRGTEPPETLATLGAGHRLVGTPMQALSRGSSARPGGPGQIADSSGHESMGGNMSPMHVDRNRRNLSPQRDRNRIPLSPKNSDRAGARV